MFPDDPQPPPELNHSAESSLLRLGFKRKGRAKIDALHALDRVDRGCGARVRRRTGLCDGANGTPADTQDPPGLTPGGPDSSSADVAQPVIAVLTAPGGGFDSPAFKQ